MPPLRLALLVALVTSLPAPAAARDPADGAGWLPRRLDLDVVVLPDVPLVVVEGTLELELVLARSAGPHVGHHEALELAVLGASRPAAVFRDEPAPGFPDGRRARVVLDTPAALGDRVELSFAGESKGGALQLDVSAEAALASWAQVWYPIPLDGGGGESTAVRSAAPGTTRLHLPAGWSAVTNGRRVAREASPEGVVETWEVTRPVARSFAAGPYTAAHHDVGERTIGVYRLGADGEPPVEQAATLARVLGALQERFGPYPFDTVAIAEVPDGVGGFGASSEQGFLMVKPGFFGWPDGNLALFGHELGHAWWGNVVGTTGPGAILCSETLAQVGAQLVIEALEGPEAATDFLRFSRPGYISDQCARGYFELVRAGRDRPLATLDSGGVNHTLSDSKAPWVFHMLRTRVGDAVYFRVLRSLVDDFAGRELSVAELRAAFERAAPDARLDAFFEQWLERTGAPELALAWEQDEAGAVELVLTQRQPGEPYELEVEVDLVAADGSRVTETVPVSARETNARVAPGFAVAEAELDPRHRLLRWTQEYGPAPAAVDDGGPVEVRFESADGTKLAADLVRPEGAGPFPTVVWIHGSGDNVAADPYDRSVAERLVDAGIAVLLADKRGCGRSEGDWREVGFDVLAADAVAAARAIAERGDVDERRLGLGGISQAGHVLPIAAALEPRLAFVVSLSGGAFPLEESGAYEIERMARKAGLDDIAVTEALALYELARAYVRGEETWAAYEEALQAALAGPWAGRGVAEGFPRTRDHWKWAWNRLNGARDPLDDWAEVRAPVLALYGDEDDLVDAPAAAARMRAALESNDDATVELLERRGHALDEAAVDRAAAWILARG